MEQNMRFGLVLGWLAILKKPIRGPIMSNFWGQFFHVFMGKNKVNSFKYCSVCTKKLLDIYLMILFFYLFLNFFGWKQAKYSQSIEDTLHDFHIMTLTIMPYPCSGKKFDINFGNRLYSKEKRPALLFSFEYNLLPKLISSFNHYMDRA